MIADEPLSLVIKKVGKVWWKRPSTYAKEALFSIFTKKRKIGKQNMQLEIDKMRGMGKTFQACLLACRHLMDGKRVAFRSPNTEAASTAFNTCLEILEKSFTIEGEKFWLPRRNPSLSISCPPYGGCIQFSTTPKTEIGFKTDVIIQDELELAVHVHSWSSRAPVVNSKEHLENILSREYE